MQRFCGCLAIQCTVSSQDYHKAVIGLSKGHHRIVTWLSKGSHRVVKGTSKIHHRDVTGWLWHSHMALTLTDSHKVVTGQSQCFHNYLAPLKREINERNDVILKAMRPGTISDGMNTEDAEIILNIILGIKVCKK